MRWFNSANGLITILILITMNKHLQNNKRLMALLMALFMGVGTSFAYDYDFSAVAPSGQTLYYDIISSSDHTVGVVSPNDTYHEYPYVIGDLIIPSEVSYNGEIYTVTVLLNNHNEGAFQMTNITSVVIPETINEVQGAAFYQCTSLTSIISCATTPPSHTGAAAFATFSGIPSSCVLYVPYGSASAYRSAWGWSGSIIEVDFVPGEITATVSPEGSGTVSGTGFYEAGATCTLSATANEGYTFSNWTENGEVVSTNANYSFLVYWGRNLVANFCLEGNISFADANVKAICVAHWDTNGDGELSYAEAAAVTDLRTYFYHNTGGIISFDELQYFTGLTSIGNSAFYNCDGLTTIEIPNSVTSIGEKAFGWCTGLTTIEIPNSVTSIGEDAFYACHGLPTIEIPNSVTSIGNSAFYYCTGLTTMTVHAETPPSLGPDVFKYVNTSIPVYVPHGSLEAYQNASGWSQFSNMIGMYPGIITATANPAEGGTVSGTGSYEGGATCTVVATANPGYAFASWQENGEVVSTDASYNFMVNGDRTLVAVFASTTDLISFADANVKAICVGNWDTDGDGELSYAEAARVTDLGEVLKNNSDIHSFNELQYFISLNAIGEQAFYGCTELTQVTIPEQVITVGSKAFWNCPALQTVYFNAVNCRSMQTTSVFSADANGGASAITRVVIGSSVTRIPDYAFKGSEDIYQRLVIPASVTEIGQHAFDGCNSLVQMVIQGSNLQTIGQYAFNNCSSIRTALNLPNSVTTVGDYAFYGCSALPSLTLGTGVASIGAYAFYNCCSGFTGDLVIPSSVTTIGNDAFYGWSGLTSVHYTGEIGQWCGIAFGNAYSNPLCYAHNLYINDALVEGLLSIPEGVAAISGYAFYNCSSLTALSIPYSVTSIGSSAFYNCNDITAVYFIGDIGQWCRIAFGDQYSNPLWYGHNLYINDVLMETLSLPDDLTAIPDYVFCGCNLTGDLVIPSSVSSIGRYAFYGCSGFTGSLIVGRMVNSIGDYAFRNCNGFTTIISENPTPPSANNNSFSGMNLSIPVHVPYNTVSDYQSAAGWNGFYNYKEQCVFDLLDNDLWSDEMNWYAMELPTETDVVCVNSNCHLDMDANVLHLYVLNLNDALTVNSGKTLTVSNGIGTLSTSQLIIADGGQVIHTNEGVKATVQKHIEAFTSDNDGWNFIASPIKKGLTVSGLIPSGTTVYDLYYMDEENTYWKNYKLNAFEINHGQGYLYANGAGTTINFGGTLQPYVEEGLPIALSNEGDGWNLVGNPFTFNAYADKSYYIINGRNVEASASGAIAPCTGIVVKATGDSETVTFTKNNPAANSNQGNLNIVLSQVPEPVDPSLRGGTMKQSTLDNAIVSFNEGSQLEKFVFNEENAKLYIPQGNEDYAIAFSNGQGEMPLNFKATKNGTYTISVNPEGVEMDYLHLIDNMTGVDVDLLQTPEYTFNAKTSDYESRFRLVFNANGNNGSSTSSEAFAFISNGNIVITDATANATLQIVDVMGRIIHSGDAMNRLSTAEMVPGVYVLRIVNGNDVKTQKMVIQ